MSDLIGFLLARLDEDQAVVREAAGLTECWVAEEPAIGVVLVDGEPLIEGHITGLTAHIARHDPARVLREIEADRALLAKLRQVEEFGEQLRVDTEILILRQVIAIRAAIWNDHPDYEGWLQ